MASWYVNSSRQAVTWATAVTLDGTATLDIYRIQVVPDGYTALKLTGYLPGYYAEQVGLPRRDYLPGETITVTTEDALRLINAGSYVPVDPDDDAAVALALAQGVYATTLWAASGTKVSTDALNTAKADTSPPPVPAVPIAPTPLPGGGGVDSGALIDLSGRLDRLQADLATTSTTDRARANHTGTQLAATISDLRETVQDIVGDLLRAGTGVSVAYDDAAGQLVITNTGSSAPGGGGATTQTAVALDDDSVPYIVAADGTVLGTDTDGVPYVVADGGGIATDTDGVPYVTA